jgi:predicted  nucleic acid-binding Zn-ribbon protein
LLVLAVGLAGCGDPDPEEALEEASAELEAARESLEAADGVVQDIRGQMRGLEEELADAERVRREAQRHVTEAEALVTERASDDVLFRAVQRRLLEDSALADAAVTAHVAARVVTLRGTVESSQLRDRAVEVAQSAPGVARVSSELEVSGAASAREADSSSAAPGSGSES